MYEDHNTRTSKKTATVSPPPRFQPVTRILSRSVERRRASWYVPSGVTNLDAKRCFWSSSVARNVVATTVLNQVSDVKCVARDRACVCECEMRYPPFMTMFTGRSAHHIQKCSILSLLTEFGVRSSIGAKESLDYVDYVV